MQLLITSVDAIWDELTEDFFPGIIHALGVFEALSDENSVVVISLHEERLKCMKGTGFDTYHINPKVGHLRKNAELIDYIVKEQDHDYSDIFILAGKSDDFYMASNANIVFFRAHFAIENNPDDPLWEKDYGIKIGTTDQLSAIFETYLNIEDPWYYSLEVDDITTIYSLTNANTLGRQNETKIKISDKLRAYLKDGIDTNKNAIGTYLTMAVSKLFKEKRIIDYFGYYPSSSMEENPELNHLRRILKTTFCNQRLDHNLLLRIKDKEPRKHQTRHQRISNGCDAELSTIKINPKYAGRLKGKTVCIIDDFTTYGTSCETVRSLFTAAGVAQIIFITIGRFGNDYYSYQYELEGNIYKKFSYTRGEEVNRLGGKFNSRSNWELINTLKRIL